MKKLEEIIAGLRKESRRAKVIIGAIVLENHLEELLRKKLIGTNSEIKELFSDSNSPLKSFSGKTKIAYHIGLISKELKRDIEIIRKFRNECAHEISDVGNNDSFNSKIIKLKSNLSKVGEALSKIPDYKSQWDNNEEAFSIIIAYIAAALTNKTNTTNQFENCPPERAYTNISPKN